jgi:hypothetical protein
VSEHLKAAAALLSDRKSPDFRNSVKESISAVETASRIISGNSKATLGDAIKLIDKVRGMHPALRDGLIKLYGYASDEGGIRHGLTEESNVDQADAKFMLVNCSAICTLLIERYSKS